MPEVVGESAIGSSLLLLWRKLKVIKLVVWVVKTLLIHCRRDWLPLSLLIWKLIMTISFLHILINRYRHWCHKACRSTTRRRHVSLGVSCVEETSHAHMLLLFLRWLFWAITRNFDYTVLQRSILQIYHIAIIWLRRRLLDCATSLLQVLCQYMRGRVFLGWILLIHFRAFISLSLFES